MILVNKQPLLTIGMPVYNGAAYIEIAINSLLSQKFKNWNLILADNSSNDNTWNIVQEFAMRDSRISCIRHNSNLGAVGNYKYLVNVAGGAYFMWAASDDEWSDDYLSSCLVTLEKYPELGFAGGGVCNTDPAGNCIRNYELFQNFGSQSVFRRMTSFLLSLEVNGKANMIYSVFRTDLIRDICRIENIFEGWGADMAIVGAALARYAYFQSTSAILYKRVHSNEDIKTANLIANGKYEEIQFGGNFPASHYFSYLSSLMRGMPSARLRVLVFVVMLARYLRLIVFN